MGRGPVTPRGRPAIEEKIPPLEDPDRAKYLHNVAACLHHLGRLPEATEKARAALDLARRLRLPAAELQLYIASAARCDLDDGDLTTAATLFAEAIEQLEIARSRASALEHRERASYVAELRRSQAYEGLVLVRLRQGRTAEAFALLERSRGRALIDLLENNDHDPLDDARRAALERGEQGTVEAIEHLRSELARAEERVVRADRAVEALQIRQDLAAAERAARQGELTEQVSLAERHLLALQRDRARLVAPYLRAAQPVTAGEVQAMLAPDERLLFFMFGDRNSFVFVVPPTPGEVGAHELTVTAAEVANLVEDRLRQIIGRHASRPERGLRPQPAATPSATKPELFQKLIPPDVWREIRSCNRIYVIPHGALHRLPLEALLTEPASPGKEPRYWLDDGPPIAYSVSASTLLWSRVSQRTLDIDGAIPIVALGDPVFGSAIGDRTALPPLIGSAQEVAQIAAAFEAAGSSAVVLTGERATEADLFEVAPRARRLHLATHGLVDETDRASGSGLALTAAAEPDPRNDGFLGLAELLTVWRGRLGRCELVVLSACDTHRGPLQRDDGMYGLTWGFLFSGVPTVVSSTWTVHDAVTAQLMCEFYRVLLAGEEPDALAAFTAARKTIRRQHPGPFLWAPFIYFGVPR